MEAAKILVLVIYIIGIPIAYYVVRYNLRKSYLEYGITEWTWRDVMGCFSMGLTSWVGVIVIGLDSIKISGKPPKWL